MKIYEVVAPAQTAPVQTLDQQIKAQIASLRQSREPDEKAQAEVLNSYLRTPPKNAKTLNDYLRLSAQQVAKNSGKPAPTAPATIGDVEDSEDQPATGSGVVRTVKKSISRQKSAFSTGKALGQKIAQLTSLKRQPKLRRF